MQIDGELLGAARPTAVNLRWAVEMETAGIYWTAQRFGKRALSILTISDHIFTGEALSAQERQDSFHEMMEIALETAWNAAE